MKVKNIEKVTDKKYIITMDLCTDPPFNEVKFEAIHLREDEKYIYAMCKIPNETMFRMDVKNDQMEIYNVQLGKWETEKEGQEHWVLYDEEGDEFYGSNENCQFDFSTLAGIFSYTAHRAKNQGYTDCQYAMRKVLGVS